MNINRRDLIKTATVSAMGVTGMSCNENDDHNSNEGAQRLEISSLKKWEAFQYGLFIHYGMSTFLQEDIPDGNADLSVYSPEKIDIDHWISVARDAGMKYAILTAKHVAGHCLWPSEYTDYTIANNSNKTDVVGKFIENCRQKGIKPGLYYCSWDNYHKFGSKTPVGDDWERMLKTDLPEGKPGNSHTGFTTSLYQSFQTSQIEELIKNYGPLMEIWIDIPGVLGRGYRTYLYNRIAELSPDTVIMMNTGIGDGSKFPVPYAWPSDLIAVERKEPVNMTGENKFRQIEGKKYYIPGEACDTICDNWFWQKSDKAKSDKELMNKFQICKERGLNFLLNVPPDKQGILPKEYVAALMRLKKNVNL